MSFEGPRVTAQIAGHPIHPVSLLLFNGWMGWKMVYRGCVGVADR